MRCSSPLRESSPHRLSSDQAKKLPPLADGAARYLLHCHAPQISPGERVGKLRQNRQVSVRER